MAESGDDDLTRARAGSTDALGRLLEQTRDYLLLVANRQLGQDLRAKGGASDLVQETFLEAHRDFHRFGGGSPAELRTWLRRLLFNNLGNHARRYRQAGKRELGRELPFDGADRPVDPPAPDPTPSVQMMDRERQAALESALDRLPDHYREVLVARQRDGQSYQEIGDRTGRSAEAVRKLWARAVELLQEELRHGQRLPAE